MKIEYTAYQCHLFGTSIYLYFNPYCLVNILRGWSCMHSKCSEVLICWPDSAILLGWDLQCWMAQWVVHWRAGFQGAKPLFRPIVLVQAVSSLPVGPNMMLFTV